MFLKRISEKFSGANRTDRFCYVTLALVTLFLLAIGLWEIASPFGAGHVAVLPARAIMADNMVSHRILYPVRAYAAGSPDISQAYAHHPWGTYYLFALARLVFGRHEWAIRLVPVCVSVAMPSLLFFVGARVWSKVEGALAALGWAVLPIVLAFAQFPSFEMFSVAGCLAVCLSALRYHERPTRARLLELFVVTVLAANTDWIASLFVFLTAGTSLVVLAYHVIRTRTFRGYGTQILGVLTVLVALVVTISAYLLVFHHAGLLSDFWGSADHRAHGNTTPLVEVLEHRRYWIFVMFTKLGVTVGSLGALVMFVRVLIYRRLVEFVPLIFLGVSLFHYIHFKNGADVHIYWPLPFAAQFCLSLGVFAVSAQGLARRFLKERSTEWAQSRTKAMSFVAVAGLSLLNLPDALRALDYSRDSGARLNDDGQLNLQDHDKNLALARFSHLVKPQERVMLHPSMQPNWSQDYALQRPTMIGLTSSHARSQGASSMLVDLRYAPPVALTWVRSMKHLVVGSYLFVSFEGTSTAGAALGFRSRPPGLLERYFVTSHDPIYRIENDPARTWEIRDHLRMEPNPLPTGNPFPLDLRVQHNIAVAHGDNELSARLRTEIEQGLDRRSQRQYRDGTWLIGHRLLHGTPPRLEVYFLAARPLGSDVFFDVRSRVLAPPQFSFTVVDDKEKRYGTGFEIHPALFKVGYIYVSSLEVRERPGREQFYGKFVGTQRPRPQMGTESVFLFERP